MKRSRVLALILLTTLSIPRFAFGQSQTPSPPPTQDTLTVINFEGTAPVVRLTNRLGIETTLEIDVWHQGAIPTRYFGYRIAAFRVEIAPNVFIHAPLSDFRRSRKDGDEDIVTLSSGEQLRGRLIFELRGTDERVYNVDSVTELELVSLPQSYSTSTPVAPTDIPPEQLWELYIPAIDTTYRVFGPQINYHRDSYDHFEGYFTLQLDGEATTVNFADLKEIAFLGTRDLYPHVRIVTVNGTEVESGYSPGSTTLWGYDSTVSVVIADGSNWIIAFGESAEATLTRLEIGPS